MLATSRFRFKDLFLLIISEVSTANYYAME